MPVALLLNYIKLIANLMCKVYFWTQFIMKIIPGNFVVGKGEKLREKATLSCKTVHTVSIIVG